MQLSIPTGGTCAISFDIVPDIGSTIAITHQKPTTLEQPTCLTSLSLTHTTNDRWDITNGSPMPTASTSHWTKQHTLSLPPPTNIGEDINTTYNGGGGASTPTTMGGNIHRTNPTLHLTTTEQAAEATVFVGIVCNSGGSTPALQYVAGNPCIIYNPHRGQQTWEGEYSSP